MNEDGIKNINEVRMRRTENEKNIERKKEIISCLESSNTSLGVHQYQNCNRDNRILSETIIIATNLGVQIRLDNKSEQMPKPFNTLNLVDEEAVALRDFLNLLYPEKEFPIVYNGI